MVGVGFVGGATTRNVYQLLRAVDHRAVAGVPSNGDPVPQPEANIPFAVLNLMGSIG